MNGRFWGGERIKRIWGLYAHIRREFQEKLRFGKVRGSKVKRGKS